MNLVHKDLRKILHRHDVVMINWWRYEELKECVLIKLGACTKSDYHMKISKLEYWSSKWRQIAKVS